jgi:hypothetical protein
MRVVEEELVEALVRFHGTDPALASVEIEARQLVGLLEELIDAKIREAEGLEDE